MKTCLCYFRNSELLETVSKITSILPYEGNCIIELESTVFYPQGGGQPSDLGTITKDSSKATLIKASSDGTAVQHLCSGCEDFTVGDVVALKVDSSVRHFHSRLHSAGHVVDTALFNLKLSLEPAKANHFPEAPFVEYKGLLETALPKPELVAAIQNECNRLIEEDLPVEIRFGNDDENDWTCERVVWIGGLGVGCGGTHVKSLKEIGSMTIRKIEAKKGITKIGYNIQ